MTLTHKACTGIEPPMATPVASQRHSFTPSSRNRYVIGIFADLAGALRCATELEQAAGETLIIAPATPGRKPHAIVSTPHGTSTHTLDDIPSGLRIACELAPPFCPLAVGINATPKLGHAPPGARRLFQVLVEHLHAGSVALIVHLPTPEQQVAVSRDLLEAKCDILLTHDVVLGGTCSSPGDDDECCPSCPNRNCGTKDPL